jgi:hypothetical protein
VQRESIIRKETEEIARQEMKKVKFLLVAVLGLLVFVGAGQSAFAGTLTLKLIDLGTGANFTVVDLGGTGVVSFSGAVGNFNVNVTTGLSKPTLGGPGFTAMDLNSVDVSCVAGACTGPNPDTLKILLSDINFAPMAGGVFKAKVGGTLGTGASGTFKSFVSASNTLFASGTTVNLGSFPTGAFSGSGSVPLPALPTYSMTLEADLTNPINPRDAAVSDSFNFEITNNAPEPSTVVLLGAGLVLLGIGARRRQASFNA